LATEFLTWAGAQGADVLSGRAFETGGRVPYQPLVDALRPRLERETTLSKLLSDVWLAELARLLPELAERHPNLPLTGGDEAGARVRLFEAVARLIQSLAARARRPVVLFVDDVQWADTATQDVLHYVAPRWRELGVSVLLLLNVRSEAIASDPALAEWLVSVEREAHITRIALGSLGVGETVELVQALGVGVSDDEPFAGSLGVGESSQVAGFARWLFGETNGQPFYVTETVKALVEGGALAPRMRDDGDWVLELQPSVLAEATREGFLPAGLREVLRARLGRLSPLAVTLVTTAAVLGQACSFDVLADVADISEQEALAALDEVLHGSLLREAGDNYQFAHDKIREVAYSEAGAARRRVFHRRALEVLQRDGAPAAELAHHALAASIDEPAFDLSVAAGDTALQVLAARDALEHYARARAIAERRGWTKHLADLHVRFGKAFSSLAQWAEERRELEAALERLGTDQPPLRGEVLTELLEALWWSMDLPALRRRADELRVLGEQLERADLQATALSWLAPAVAAAGDPAGCIALAEQALARGPGFTPPPTVHAYVSFSYHQLGRIQEAIVRGQESVQVAREANNVSMIVQALPQLGLSLAASGCYDEAQRVFAEARRYGTEYGIRTMLARAIAMSAGYHLDLFDYAGNEVLAEEARELARSLGFQPPAISAGLDLLLNFARRQDVDRAEKLVVEVGEIVENATAWHGWLWGLRFAEARAEIALARGDWDAALSLAAQAIEQSRLRGRVKYEALGLTTRSRALVAVGRTSDAIADSERAVNLARQMGDPALFVRATSVLLTLDGSDTLAAEARAGIERIVAALPDDELRRLFKSAEPVRAVLSSAT
jgi:tetratricopeptide (TPR) repeat protein